MDERRVEARVIGPGARGHLRVRLGQREQDVPMDRLPPTLRALNSEFVAVVQGGNLLRIDALGPAWLDIQDKVRSVLNRSWDPIGIAGDVEDEYDSYIADIYEMLRVGSSPHDLAAHLLQIETESMGLHGSPGLQRLEVARQLLALELPTP